MSVQALGLAELQRWFAAATTEPHGVNCAQTLDQLVTPGPHLSATARMQIYNDGYVVRLVECLADDYPALCYALGEDAFEALCRDYIAQHPSRSPSLNAYGAGFAGFCLARPEAWSGFAAELSRLEWALVEVVHEPSATALTPESLAAVPAASLQTVRLRASSAVRLLSCQYPVNAFYRSFREGGEPRIPERAATAVVVYRDGLSLWRRDLEPNAAFLLERLLSGAPLMHAVEALEQRVAGSDSERALAERLPEWLSTWVKSGFFSEVYPR